MAVVTAGGRVVVGMVTAVRCSSGCNYSGIGIVVVVITAGGSIVVVVVTAGGGIVVVVITAMKV